MQSCATRVITRGRNTCSSGVCAAGRRSGGWSSSARSCRTGTLSPSSARSSSRWRSALLHSRPPRRAQSLPPGSPLRLPSAAPVLPSTSLRPRAGPAAPSPLHRGEHHVRSQTLVKHLSNKPCGVARTPVPVANPVAPCAQPTRRWCWTSVNPPRQPTSPTQERDAATVQHVRSNGPNHLGVVCSVKPADVARMRDAAALQVSPSAAAAATAACIAASDCDRASCSPPRQLRSWSRVIAHTDCGRGRALMTSGQSLFLAPNQATLVLRF